MENRTRVELKDVSKNIINALIATEDSRFYEHSGIDQKSLMRVIFKSIILGDKSSGGGSTLSQQLIKNLFGREQHGMFTMPVAKIKEGILANKLNSLYTKDEILALYLNTVSFGEDTYGIGTACERFFDVTAKDVSVDQAAILIGMLKAPTTYNPRINPEKSIIRRNTVLHLMVKNNFLDAKTKDNLTLLPIELKYNRKGSGNGAAAYLRTYIKKEIDEILSGIKKENGDDYDIKKDGLKIYTTINHKIQSAAENSVKRHMSVLTKKLRREVYRSLKSGNNKSIVINELKKSNRYKTNKKKKLNHKENIKALSEPVNTIIFTFKGEKDTLISPLDSIIHSLSFLQSTYLGVNPQKGNILAYVGGIDHKNFPYDRVLSKRQVGSTFKPIIYSNALINGEQLCNKYKNIQTKYTKYDDWTPKNSDSEYGGKFSLLGAITNSVNTVSVQLLMKKEINKTLEYCRELGIQDSLPHVPSLALGVANLSLKTMLETYSIFANEGKKIPFYTIEKITTYDGKIIYEHKKVEGTEIIEKEITDQLTHMLQSVVDNGTGKRLRSRYKFTNNIAGKTGTTQNQTDGWFIGYTPTYLAGVWTGADLPAIHFSSIKEGQGANMALPIWANTFKAILKDNKLKKKYTPNFNHEIETDCELFYPEKEGFLHNLFKRKKPKVNKNDGIEGKKKFRLFKKKK